jgi:hypothetical protein
MIFVRDLRSMILVGVLINPNADTATLGRSEILDRIDRAIRSPVECAICSMNAQGRISNLGDVTQNECKAFARRSLIFPNARSNLQVANLQKHIDNNRIFPAPNVASISAS